MDWIIDYSPVLLLGVATLTFLLYIAWIRHITAEPQNEEATVESGYAQVEPQPCVACRGTGFCIRCRGDGRYAVRGTGSVVTCPDCMGSGECGVCGGTGQVKGEEQEDE